MEAVFSIIGLVLLALAVLALMMTYGVGRRKGRESGHLSERFISAIGFVALLVAVLTTVRAIFEAVDDLSGEVVDVDAKVNTESVLPKRSHIEWDEATVRHADITTVNLGISGLSSGIRMLLASGTILHAVPVVAVALFVWRLCRAASGTAGLSDRLRRGGFVTAVVVLVAGLAGEWFSSVGSGEAAVHSLGAWSFAKEPAGSDGTDLLPVPYGNADLSMTPVVAAVLIAVVSEVIARVVALQRDKDRLEADVSGLV